MKAILMTISLGAIVFLGLMYGMDKDAVRSENPEVTVYQSRTCGCCHKWVRHLENSGFKVKSVMLDDVQPVKERLKIPNNLASCHTAKIGDYIVEGHVPASAIKKLLASRPAVKGLTVPGMPMGSPGMEGHFKENYDVLSFDESGNKKVFMSF